MKTALITGASGGIGFELAKIHAATGGNLVLVARNKNKLDEVKHSLEARYHISVYTIARDLSDPGAADEIYQDVLQQNLKVDYLINNAGFGDYGMFVDAHWEKQLQMINLNVITLTRLTHLYLPEMVKKRSGKIMNLASTAAFQPGPTMSVYFATKAYVLSLSEALANEVKAFGVTITALCPGATESGFQAAAEMEDSRLVKDRKLPSAEAVAKYGYNAMMKGKTVAIHGTMNKILANAIRLMPRKTVVNMTRKIQEAK